MAETSLPCEAADEDPDEGNPMDNLSCPFADGLQCIAVSELCDGHSVCVGDYDEGGVTSSDYSDDEDGLSQQSGSGSGGVPVIVILECSMLLDLCCSCCHFAHENKVVREIHDKTIPDPFIAELQIRKPNVNGAVYIWGTILPTIN